MIQDPRVELIPSGLRERLQPLEILSQGFGGIVCLCFDLETRLRVVLKVVRHGENSDATSVERFGRESLLLSKLDHPSIVRLLDAGVQEGRHFLVMEFVRGQNLLHTLRVRGRIPPAEVAWWGVAVAGALAAVHDAGILHRDLKLENVILEPDRGPVLIDFGLAKAHGVTPTITTAGHVYGTPLYMAPEIIAGSAASPASDLYSLGCMLHALLGGGHPFSRDGGVVKICEAHLREPPPPLDGVPDQLVTIVTRLLAKAPSCRQADARTVLIELRSFLDFAPERVGSRPGVGPGLPLPVLPGLDLSCVIGQGGMGTVYRGIQTALDRPVAVKVMRKELLADPVAHRRFLREIEATGRLDHPNLVRIHTWGEHGDSLYYVMELIEGLPLSALMNREPPLSLQEVISIIRQILDALTACHEIGIVHRDIKPANILVTSDLHVTVMDLGVVRIQDGTHLTSAGSLVGTLQYMAPEVICGETASGASDVWAVGIVAHQLLGGSLPFPDTYIRSIVQFILNGTIPQLRSLRPDLSPRLAAVLDRMVAKDPAERFRDARHALHALDLAVRARAAPGPFARGAVPGRSRLELPPGRRSVVPGTGVRALVLGLFGALALWVAGPGRERSRIAGPALPTRTVTDVITPSGGHRVSLEESLEVFGARAFREFLEHGGGSRESPPAVRARLEERLAASRLVERIVELRGFPSGELRGPGQPGDRIRHVEDLRALGSLLRGKELELGFDPVKLYPASWGPVTLSELHPAHGVLLAFSKESRRRLPGFKALASRKQIEHPIKDSLYLEPGGASVHSTMELLQAADLHRASLGSYLDDHEIEPPGPEPRAMDVIVVYKKLFPCMRVIVSAVAGDGASRDLAFFYSPGRDPEEEQLAAYRIPSGYTPRGRFRLSIRAEGWARCPQPVRIFLVALYFAAPEDDTLSSR